MIQPQTHNFEDPNYISIQSPFESPLHYAGLEFVVYLCFALTVWHVATKYKEGDSSHLFQWVALFVYGLIMELVAFYFMQNYTHVTFTLQFYHGELPLYVTCIYLVFHYTGFKVVERLGLPLITGGLLAGLSIMLMDVPFDSLGVDATWWSWADNQETALHPRFVEAVATRWFGVPITSYYWYLMYGALLYIFSHWFYAKISHKALWAKLLLAPLVSIAVVIAGAMAFEILFWQPRGLGVSEHLIVAIYLGLVLLLAIRVRAPNAKPAEPWLFFVVTLFYGYHLLVMFWLWYEGELTYGMGKILLISGAAIAAFSMVKIVPFRKTKVLLPTQRVKAEEITDDEEAPVPLTR